MSTKKVLKAAWSRVSRDSGVLVGVAQLTIATADIILRSLDKRRARKQLADGGNEKRIRRAG